MTPKKLTTLFVVDRIEPCLPSWEALGYKVTVLADACACVDERLERIALEYLRAVVGVFVEPQ